jgi:hypothetical protein
MPRLVAIHSPKKLANEVTVDDKANAKTIADITLLTLGQVLALRLIKV